MAPRNRNAMLRVSGIAARVRIAGVGKNFSKFFHGLRRISTCFSVFPALALFSRLSSQTPILHWNGFERRNAMSVGHFYEKKGNVGMHRSNHVTDIRQFNPVPWKLRLLPQAGLAAQAGVAPGQPHAAVMAPAQASGLTFPMVKAFRITGHDNEEARMPFT